MQTDDGLKVGVEFYRGIALGRLYVLTEIQRELANWEPSNQQEFNAKRRVEKRLKDVIDGRLPEEKINVPRT